MDGAKKSGIAPLEIPKSAHSSGNMGIRPGLTPTGKEVSQASVTDAKTSASVDSSLNAEAGDTKAVTARTAQPLPASAQDMRGRYHKFHSLARKLTTELDKTPAPTQKELSAHVKRLYEGLAAGTPIALPATQRNELARARNELTDEARRNALTEHRTGQPAPLPEAIRAQLLNALNGLMQFTSAPVETRLQAVLDDQVLCGELHSACKEALVTENVDFLLAVNQARHLSDEPRLNAYRATFRNFVKAGAEQEVNLPDDIRKSVAHALQNGQLSAADEALTRAYTEILGMLCKQKVVQNFMKRE